MVFLCTGNVCRSPMAEVLLRQRLTAAGIHGNVSSAGVWRADEVASDGAVKAMGKLGLDLSEHRSRLLSRQLIDDADLVIGLACEHVREVVVLAPEAFARSFTLKELVRRGEAVGPVTGSLECWLAAVNDGRELTDLLGASTDDDVEDPIGRSDAVFRRTAAELSSLIDRLVILLAGVRTEAVS